jgi:hypothetical protein
MENNKIIRSICYFIDTLDKGILEKIENIAGKLESAGYEIQTRRICSTGITIKEIDSAFDDPSL